MLIELNNRQHSEIFVRLNEQWISHFFALEEGDRKLAANPFKVVEDGGCILSLVDTDEIAADNTSDSAVADQVLGVCALFKDSDSRYQLARMAVDPRHHGKGYGDILILAALDQAKKMGATSVYLLSNTKLVPALALYRKHGFTTLVEGQHPVYARSNITMELNFPA